MNDDLERQSGEPGIGLSDSPAPPSRSGFDWSQAPSPWNEIGPAFRRLCEEIVAGAAALDTRLQRNT
jgi:hypothetical protein